MTALTAFYQRLKPFKLTLMGLMASILLWPLNLQAENVAVAPDTWDYGDVEVGNIVPMLYTITSTGPDTALRVTSVTIVDSQWEAFVKMGCEPEEPVTISVGETMECVVAFLPPFKDMFSGSLLIMSDAHNWPLLFVPLQGQGIDIEPTPDEIMDMIMSFYEDSVADGTIYGLGAGNAPAAHLRIFLGMLDAADDLIVAGDYEGACSQLEHAVLKSDGMDQPPDFIGGPGVSSLNNMLLEVMNALDCDE